MPDSGISDGLKRRGATRQMRNLDNGPRNRDRKKMKPEPNSDSDPADIQPRHSRIIYVYQWPAIRREACRPV